MNNKLKIALFAAEVLAVATLRGVYLMKRERQVMPRGSKVRHASGRPVFSTPSFVGSFGRGRKKAEPKQPDSIKVGSIDIPIENPDTGRPAE